MESVPKGNYFKFNPNQLTEVRKIYNLEKPGRMDETINLLQEWVKKQEHFRKKDFTRQHLEVTIILSKGSVERAKTRISKLCTYKTMWPHYFVIPDLTTWRKETEAFRSIIIPRPTADHIRINICKIRSGCITPEIISEFVKYGQIISEYVKMHDYSDGFIIIADGLDVDLMELLPNVRPTVLSQVMTILQEGYGMRILGIHLLTASRLAHAAVSLVKQVVSEKIGNRIHVHKTVDTLYDYVPKSLLPRDYGGDELSLEELQDLMWKEYCSEENMANLKEMQQATVDETKRIPDNIENVGGMVGSFRTLCVD